MTKTKGREKMMWKGIRMMVRTMVKMMMTTMIMMMMTGVGEDDNVKDDDEADDCTYVVPFTTLLLTLS